MKLWVYILTFLMMSVILVPCSDEPGQNHRMLSNSVSHFEDGNSHNHEHEANDTCSPFCYCQCCSFASLTSIDFETVEVKPLEFHFSTEEPIYTNLYSFGSHPTLFQPPRV